MRKTHIPGQSWFVIEDQDQVAMLLLASTQVDIGVPDSQVLESLQRDLEVGKAYFLWAINHSTGHEVWSPSDSRRFLIGFESITRGASTHGSMIMGVWKIPEEVLQYAYSLSQHREKLVA